MNKRPLSRLVVALGLAQIALAAHAVNPPEYETYTKQLWMDESASDVDGGGLSANSTNVNQSNATSGLVDIYQNGEANNVGTYWTFGFEQRGAGNVMRIGQGASYDASAQDWASRWSGGDAVRGNSVWGGQYGSNNTGSVIQTGDNSSAGISQFSDNNTASINQAGNSHAGIWQGGQGGSTALIEQLGNSAYKTAYIDQFGSGQGSTAKIRQNDSDEMTHTSVFQNGSSANADINQSGGSLYANQGGQNNSLRVGQTNAVRFSQRQWNYDPTTYLFSTFGGMDVQQNGDQGSINIDSNQASTGALSGSINQSGNLGQITVINDTLQSANSPEVYIQQSGTNQNVTASFSDEGGVVDIQQSNGGTGNTLRAAVSGGASMTLNQEGSDNLIDAELGGGSLTVGSTDRSASGTGTAGQLGADNRLVVRGNAGAITATQDGNNNKMHLGAAVGYSGADVSSVQALGSGISGGTLSLAQSGENNLMNVSGTTPGANLTVNQRGGARVDIGTVSSTVNIMQ